jgi:hypothetical protein
MAVSPQLWTQLEAHGVTQAHLEALLRFARCERNGHFTWHWHQGRLTQCEVLLVFPSKQMDHINEALREVDK